MPNTRIPIDAGAFLREQGIKIQQIDDNDDLLAQFPDGSTGPLKVEQVAKDLGIDDMSKFSLEWNSPDEAIAVSPVSLTDRLQLTTSVDNRSLPFLKKRFEDAVVHPDNGVLVKHKGAWHQVDPSGLGSGDAWSKTKEFAKDVVDIADDVASAFVEGAGAAGAGAVGMLAGPVGGYAGAVGGAAAANKGFNKARFRLGKMLGTYTATEQEQDADEALEMLYAAGGQAVAPVVGGAFKGLAKGVKATPKVLLNIQAKLLGTEVDNLYRVADRPEQIENAVKTVWSMAKARASQPSRATSDMAQSAAVEVQQKTIASMLDEASDLLPKKYVEIVRETAEEAGEEFTADIGKMAHGILSSLSSGETPFLKKIVKEVPEGSIESAFQRLAGGQKTGPKVTYRPLKDTEVLRVGGESFFDQKSFNRFVRQVQGLTKAGKLKGEDAVEALARIKKGINEVMRYPAQNAPASEMSKIAKVGAAVDQHLDGVFGDKNSPLRQLWESKAEPYRRYAKAVNWGRRVLKDETGRQLETFTKQVASNKAGKGMAPKAAAGLGGTIDDEAGSLVELLGSRGTELATRVADYEAARAMAPTAPRLGMVQLLGSGMALTGPVGLPAKAGMLALGLAQSTPALVRKEIQGATWVRSKTAKAIAPFTDLIKGISKSRDKNSFVKAMTNEKFVQQLAAGMAKSVSLETSRDAYAQQILDWKLKQTGEK